jgi:hypothetical protein
MAVHYKNPYTGVLYDNPPSDLRITPWKDFVENSTWPKEENDEWRDLVPKVNDAINFCNEYDLLMMSPKPVQLSNLNGKEILADAVLFVRVETDSMRFFCAFYFQGGNCVNSTACLNDVDLFIRECIEKGCKTIKDPKVILPYVDFVQKYKWRDISVLPQRVLKQ